MNCIDFRRQIAAEPQTQDAALREHERDCTSCAALARQYRAMDGVLARALEVAVPASIGDAAALTATIARAAAERPVAGGAPRARAAAPVWLALAAGVVLAIGLSAGLLLGRASSPLAGDLVAHVQHEAQLLLLAGPDAAAAQVNAVLDSTGVTLNGSVGPIYHAGLCPFRGKSVSHLVIRGETGAVTVMLLPDTITTAPTAFDEQGFSGVIVPAGSGSIAILGPPGEPLEPVRERFSRSVEFSI